MISDSGVIILLGLVITAGIMWNGGYPSKIIGVYIIYEKT
jgi:hypothetical protein